MMLWFIDALHLAADNIFIFISIFFIDARADAYVAADIYLRIMHIHI